MKRVYIKKIETLRLSNNAKVSLRYSSIIAEYLKESLVSPSHIFVGLLLNTEGMSSRVVEEMGIDRNRLIEEVIGRGALDITSNVSKPLNIKLSSVSQDILRKAYSWSQKFFHVYVGSEHIMLAILSSNDPLVKKINKNGLTKESFEEALEETATYPLGILSKPDLLTHGMEGPLLVDSIGVDLTDKAKKGEIDPLIGRESEIQEILNILSRRKKNNPLIVGPSGVGKTVLIEGLAQRIVDGKVPPSLEGCRIVSVDVNEIMAGSRMRGDVEEKVMELIDEVITSKKIILFIDEIHSVINSGIPGSASDIASVLKPALLKEGFRCIGTTTEEDYTRNFDNDNAFSRRFQPVKLEEPSIEDTKKILEVVKSLLESHHKIKISEEALETALTLSDRYVADRYLPDKAIDLLDEACAAKKISIESEFKNLSVLNKKLEDIRKKKEKEILKEDMEKANRLKKEESKIKDEIKRVREECSKEKRSKLNQVSSTDVRKILSKWTGIPVNTLGISERSELLKLDESLEKSVIGQKEAVKSVSSAIKRARTGISDAERPWASFLFLGPTGVGKTELAKVLTRELFGDEDRLIQVDMSEMMEQHSVSKLIGSPPGYVGFQEGGRLTESVRRQPHSVILFDEVEKAHPDVLNILLQILEYGHLTDGRGRVVNFKNTVIVLTSNIGAEDIKESKILGFGKEEKEKRDEDIEKEYETMKNHLTSRLKNVLRPELINRLDDIIIFRALGRKDAREIVKLLINELNKRLEDQGYMIILDSKVISRIVKEGFSDEYGARPLRREIQNSVENILAEYILKNGENTDLKKIKKVLLTVDKKGNIVIKS